MALLKTYSIANDTASGEVDINKLNSEIQTAGHVNGYNNINIVGDNIEVYGDTFADEVANDSIVSAHEKYTLDEYKQKKYYQIDTKTEELIQQGFVYATKTFSLSELAQINLLGLKMNKDVITYPLTWATIDDSDSYDIADATDAENFHLASLNTKMGHLNSGNALKAQVIAATDKAGVDAVTDNR